MEKDCNHNEDWRDYKLDVKKTKDVLHIGEKIANV